VLNGEMPNLLRHFLFFSFYFYSSVVSTHARGEEQKPEHIAIINHEPTSSKLSCVGFLLWNRGKCYDMSAKKRDFCE